VMGRETRARKTGASGCEAAWNLTCCGWHLHNAPPGEGALGHPLCLVLGRLD
jgi:hypothetical protein